MTTGNKKRTVAAGLPPGKNCFSLISKRKLLDLYCTMLKCRMIAECARIILEQNKLNDGGCAAGGLEAVAAGVVIDLLPEDTISPSPRDLMACFVKGVPPHALFSHLQAHAAKRGKDHASRGRMEIAIGLARANKMKNNNKIVVVFCDEECPAPGSPHKALKVAGAENLPMIFVSRNNLQTDVGAPTLKTQTYGFPRITVDSNDVVAIYRVASEAIAHARLGHGPTLIECKPYRVRGHSEAGPTVDRDGEAVQRWKADNPLLNMEKYLTRKGLFSERYKRKVAAGSVAL